MYLCICNAISDRRVRDAVAAGARDWVAVHAHAGCQPNCGKCAADISDEIIKPAADLRTPPAPEAADVQPSEVLSAVRA